MWDKKCNPQSNTNSSHVSYEGFFWHKPTHSCGRQTWFFNYPSPFFSLISKDIAPSYNFQSSTFTEHNLYNNWTRLPSCYVWYQVYVAFRFFFRFPTTRLRPIFAHDLFLRTFHSIKRCQSIYGLWWTDTLDPAHIIGDTAMCWVKGIRLPQPEQIDTDGTTFFRDFYDNRQLNDYN